MNIENIMLKERSQLQKIHIIRFYLYEMFRIGKSTETESRSVVVRGWGEGKMGSDGASLGVIKMFQNEIDGYTTQCIY